VTAGKKKGRGGEWEANCTSPPSQQEKNRKPNKFGPTAAAASFAKGSKNNMKVTDLKKRGRGKASAQTAPEGGGKKFRGKKENGQSNSQRKAYRVSVRGTAAEHKWPIKAAARNDKHPGGTKDKGKGHLP